MIWVCVFKWQVDGFLFFIYSISDVLSRYSQHTTAQPLCNGAPLPPRCWNNTDWSVARLQAAWCPGSVRSWCHSSIAFCLILSHGRESQEWSSLLWWTGVGGHGVGLWALFFSLPLPHSWLSPSCGRLAWSVSLHFDSYGREAWGKWNRSMYVPVLPPSPLSQGCNPSMRRL